MLNPNDPGQQKLEDDLSGAQDQFKKTSKAMKLAEFSTERLAALAKLGDTVQPEDVIEAAGAIVSKGGSAVNMASALSTMPTTGGEQLAGWIAQKVQAFAQLSQQLEQAHEAARHQLGVGALRSVVGHTVQRQIEQARAQNQGPAGPQALGAQQGG